MSQVREAQINRFRRDAWLEINLENLEYNLKKLYSWHKKPLLPVLKADAYGHGAAVIVKTLDAYNFIYGYGVANIDEALNLREASKNKIIVLGICPEWAIKPALEHDIDLIVANEDFIYELNNTAQSLNKIAKVHIKLDTGMNRIGFKNSQKKFQDLVNDFEKLANIQIETIFTHFADPQDREFCQYQYDTFSKMTEGLDYPKHPVSSQSANSIENFDFDIMRCGIELYGLENPELKPLLSLYARINFIKDIQAGESVSYKRKWQAETATKIATLPLGYADGVPRILSNQIQTFAKNKFYKQVGSITMDQMMIDIGLDSDLKIGDVVELIGPNISIQSWAKQANTISYEIATNLNLRLPKSYTR